MFAFNHLKLKIASLLLLLLLSPAYAAAQGLLLTVSSDIALGTWAGVGDKESAVGVCVYNMSGSGYAITASATGGAFNLSGASGSIPYSVSFSGSGLSGPFSELSYGNSRSFSGADESAANCGGSNNAAIRITVSEAALGAAAPGSYSGTLTVILTAS